MAATAASQPAALWPEADRLFHSDPRWLGSDAAYSVPLSPNRILWLFGDTFVARRRGQTRRQSRMARNTIGIQTGRNPATASIRFYWRPEGSGSFFPGESPNWLWPEHGIRTERGLLLFFMVVKPAGKSGPFAFRNDGWTAFLIPNPDAVPGRWRLRQLAAPPNPWRIMVGTAVVREAEWLYLFAVAEPRHEAFLLRLPAGTSGDLSALEWWCGEGRGWQPQVALQSRPDPIFEDAATEFSVHRDPATGSYIQLQSQGFPASDVSIRTAARLTGPWTPLRKLYRPPQSNLPGLMVYAAKAHPELEGAPLLVTYATNGDDARMAAEPGLYFPRFLRLSLDK